MLFKMTFRLVEVDTIEELYKIEVVAAGPIPMPIPADGSLITIERYGQYRAAYTYYDYRRDGVVITTWVKQRLVSDIRNMEAR